MVQKLTLAYPPSANRYWRMARGHIHKSNEARAYQQEAALRARAAKIEMVGGDVYLRVDVYRPAKRGDLDNTLKVMIDALKGIAYMDDSQIVSIIATRCDDKANPRVDVMLLNEPLI